LVCCTATVSHLYFRLLYRFDSHLNRWTFGANRVQVDADIKVLSEFLSYLQTDSVRGSVSISSLCLSQSPSPTSCTLFTDIFFNLWDVNIPVDYTSRLKKINHPLRLLVENEIFRLAVWANPSNETKRGTDHVGTSERNMLEVSGNSYPDICFTVIDSLIYCWSQSSWTTMVRIVWKIDPAIAVYSAERFKSLGVQSEVGKLVRSSTLDVLDTPEAVHFLVGDRVDLNVRRDFKAWLVYSLHLFLADARVKHLLLWTPVPPVLAVTFFEHRYNNDPLILQYAHRVLEQHHVDLSFFFVPQIVQALRYDDLGEFILDNECCGC
jgi:phosphatidylinositol 4-kinase A